MNECFYCLDCQVAYYDDHVCPPLVWRRKRQQSASEVAPAAALPESRGSIIEDSRTMTPNEPERQHLTAEPRCRAGEL